MSAFDTQFAAGARAQLLAVFGRAGTWTDGRTSATSSVTGRLNPQEGRDGQGRRVADLTISSADVADPQPTDTWTDTATGDIWTVADVMIRDRAGRHVLAVYTRLEHMPREV